MDSLSLQRVEPFHHREPPHQRGGTRFSWLCGFRFSHPIKVLGDPPGHGTMAPLRAPVLSSPSPQGEWSNGSLAPSPRFDLQQDALAALARCGLLRPYLRQQLLQESVAQEDLSEEERRQAVVSFAQERRLPDGEALERFRVANLFTPEALAVQVELPLRIHRHCERLYRPKAEARFLERKHQLDRVVYSLLRLEDEGLARELYLQLQEGEANFADLAANYAEGPERATRGIVGPVPLTQAHPQLVERLRTAPAGVVQEPFQIERWWLVFRLESLTPASFDEPMALQMSQELFEQWLEQAVEARLQQLRPLLLSPVSAAQPR
ncbi:MAG: peptidylprolyl isomerase [Synechococcaceae bacterium WB8_1B_136]|nr:peptidylprolyl isomerase [Synechococcaceae bacterium WB8_1B_136]